MSRVTIKQGAEFDVLDANEARTILQESLSGYLRPEQTERFAAGGITDANGAVTIKAYRPVMGYEFHLTRLGIFPDGYTFGAPFSAAGTYFNILREGIVEDGGMLDVTSGGFSLPYVYTETKSKALVFYGAELLEVEVVGGNTFASKPVIVRGQGILRPLPPA